MGVPTFLLQLVAYLVNFMYLCTANKWKMEQYNLFEITFMDDATEFIESLPPAARQKIYYNLRKVKGGFISDELFKKLDGRSDLWEFRTLYNGIQYRLLAFWDAATKRMVVATHGFVKKAWKVPSK